MSKEMREQINRVQKFNQRLNENKSTEKTILNLIFDENEISELYRIKEDSSINYLRDLDFDPFSSQDEDELLDFIKNSLNQKGVTIDKYDMKSILDLVNNNVRI